MVSYLLVSVEGFHIQVLHAAVQLWGERKEMSREGLPEVSGCEDRIGSRESVQQRVGGESSDTESYKAGGRLLGAGTGPCPGCQRGTGAAELPHQPPTHWALWGGCGCTYRPCSSAMPTCRALSTRGPPVRQMLTPGTHHGGLGAVVGLHDGETQRRHPLHCPSRLRNELGALCQPVLWENGGERAAGVGVGSWEPPSPPSTGQRDSRHRLRQASAYGERGPAAGTVPQLWAATGASSLRQDPEEPSLPMEQPLGYAWVGQGRREAEREETDLDIASG